MFVMEYRTLISLECPFDHLNVPLITWMSPLITWFTSFWVLLICMYMTQQPPLFPSSSSLLLHHLFHCPVYMYLLPSSLLSFLPFPFSPTLFTIFLSPPSPFSSSYIPLSLLPPLLPPPSSHHPRYASLYFCVAIEPDDNELITLEIIHRYVELLDKYFGSVSWYMCPLLLYTWSSCNIELFVISQVCELDIIFNFEKVSSGGDKWSF